MELFAVIFSRTVLILLGLVQTAMFFRAILSWFMPEENGLTYFLALLTEPFIAPVRFVLSRFRFAQELPFDISFMVTFLLLFLIETILPVMTL